MFRTLLGITPPTNIRDFGVLFPGKVQLFGRVANFQQFPGFHLWIEVFGLEMVEK